MPTSLYCPWRENGKWLNIFCKLDLDGCVDGFNLWGIRNKIDSQIGVAGDRCSTLGFGLGLIMAYVKVLLTNLKRWCRTSVQWKHFSAIYLQKFIQFDSTNSMWVEGGLNGSYSWKGTPGHIHISYWQIVNIVLGHWSKVHIRKLKKTEYCGQDTSLYFSSSDS